MELGERCKATWQRGSQRRIFYTPERRVRARGLTGAEVHVCIVIEETCLTDQPISGKLRKAALSLAENTGMAVNTRYCKAVMNIHPPLRETEVGEHGSLQQSD